MKEFTLDGRLAAAAEYVRQGALFADIGTDHAYLPTFLLLRGRIERAVAADIKPGPLSSAMEHAEKYGVRDRMTFFLSDGLDAVTGCMPDDIAVCGMGGELIADIVTRSDLTRRGGVHLILQPMTRQAYLRRALASAGYPVLSEKYSLAAGHAYVTLLCTYTGVPYETDDLTSELGAGFFSGDMTPAKRHFLLRRLAALRDAAEGRERAGEYGSYERKIYDKISSMHI